MTAPSWADETLSNDLPVLRSRGEGQDMEYMETFPQNTRELAREIAAFATSNTGTIVIGVSDSGDLVGIDFATTMQGRDTLIGRLEGISRGTVKPGVTPTAKFAVEDEKIVLVITVPKGPEPVYYHGHTPYVRHLTQSRPADPHEVIALISENLGISIRQESTSIVDSRDAMYSGVLSILVDILLVGDEVEERKINPWLDMWRSEFGYGATELREVAAGDIARSENMDQKLLKLADLLDKVSEVRLHMSVWPELMGLTEKSLKLAREMLDEINQASPLHGESLEQARTLVVRNSRKLADLASRSTGLAKNGRLDELQSEAAEIGREVARVGYYNISSLRPNIDSDLREIGHALHLTETLRVYMDGGKSVDKIVEHVATWNQRLAILVENLG